MPKITTVILQSLTQSSKSFDELMAEIQTKASNVNHDWTDEQWVIHLRSNLGRLITFGHVIPMLGKKKIYMLNQEIQWNLLKKN
jgi:hypothetical protein